MKFHKDGTLPASNEIFVFGSNLAGAHGAGAALVARERFGAAIGMGEGLTGRAYAIPTKDSNIQTVPLPALEMAAIKFVVFARQYTELQFFVTSIGCGLAGYTPAEIAPMFHDAPDNCSFPDTWKPYLEPQEAWSDPRVRL